MKYHSLLGVVYSLLVLFISTALSSTTTCLLEPVCKPVTYSNFVAMYRVYSAEKKDHAFTTSDSEVAEMLKNGYSSEGESGFCSRVPIPDITIPLYRYFDAIHNDHFYTTELAEGNLLQESKALTNEGISCHIFKNSFVDTAPLLRYYNSATKDHLYTIRWEELQQGSSSYKYQRTEGHMAIHREITRYTCEIVKNCDQEGSEATVFFGADDIFYLYRNSELKMVGENFSLPTRGQFRVKPYDIISIQVFNHPNGSSYGSHSKSNPGGLVGMISYSDKQLFTDSTQWKCINGRRLEENIDNWPSATDYGSSNNWEVSPSAIQSDNVRFIWSSQNFIAGQWVTCSVKIPSFCGDKNREWDGKKCTCKNSCVSDKIQNADCECVCEEGKTVEVNIDGNRRCMNTKCPLNQVWNSQWTGCQCPNKCSTHDEELTVDCKCACKPGFTRQTNTAGQTKCEQPCDNSLKKWSSSWRKCECTNKCPAGYTTDSACNCVCAPGTSKQYNINKHEKCMPACPNNKVWNSDFTQCICDNTCPATQIRNDIDCSCSCEQGTVNSVNSEGLSRCMVGCAVNQIYDSKWQCSCIPGVSKIAMVYGVEKCVSNCQVGQLIDATWTRCITSTTCPENQIVSSGNTGVCVCISGTTVVKNVAGEKKCKPTCPIGKQWNADWTRCECINQCSADKVNNDKCECTCSPGQSLQQNIEGISQCANKCPYENQVYNSNWGACQCVQGYELAENEKGEWKCLKAQNLCSNKLQKFSADWSQCQCANECASSIGFVKDPNTCECVCPVGQELSENETGDKKCMSPCEVNQYYDSTWSICKCYNGFTRKVNVKRDSRCLRDECGSGQLYDENWKSCVCQAQCGLNEHSDDSSCNCKCNSGLVKQVNSIGEERCMEPCESKNPLKRYTRLWGKCKCVNRCIEPEILNEDTCKCELNASRKKLEDREEVPITENLINALVDKERLKEIRLWKQVVIAREYMRRLEALLKKLEIRYKVVKEEYDIVIEILDELLRFQSEETKQNTREVMTMLHQLLEEDIKQVLIQIRDTKAQLEIAKADFVAKMNEYNSDRPERMKRLYIADEAKLRARIIESEGQQLQRNVMNDEQCDEQCDITRKVCGLNSEPVIILNDKSPERCKTCSCQPNLSLTVFTNVSIPLWTHGNLIEQREAPERAPRITTAT